MYQSAYSHRHIITRKVDRNLEGHSPGKAYALLNLKKFMIFF